MRHTRSKRQISPKAASGTRTHNLQITNQAAIAESSGKTADSAQRAAQGAAHSAPIDPGLRAVIDRWPSLPDAIRAGIVAMVKAAAVKP